VRARATLAGLGLPDALDVRVEDDLYGADPDEIVARLRTVPDAVGSVLVIAHNPGLEDLTELLVADNRTCPDRFPTAAVAELRLPIERWDDIAPHRAVLASFVTPRELDGPR